VPSVFKFVAIDSKRKRTKKKVGGPSRILFLAKEVNIGRKALRLQSKVDSFFLRHLYWRPEEYGQRDKSIGKTTDFRCGNYGSLLRKLGREKKAGEPFGVLRCSIPGS